MSAPTLFYDVDMDENNKCWFVHAFYPALISYDLNTKQSSVEEVLPYCGNGRAAYGPIKKIENKVYIAPRCSDKLLIYDTENKNLQIIALEIDSIKEEGLYNLFSSIYVDENEVFLFPGRYPAIVKYNVLTDAIEYIDDWYNADRTLWHNKQLVIFGSASVKGSEVYLPCWQKAEYYVFSLIDDSIKICKTKYSSGMSSLTFMEKEMLCSFKSNDIIYKLNSDKEVIFESSGYSGVSKISAWGDMVFVFPMKGGNISMYSNSSNSWKHLETMNAGFEEVGKQYQIYDCNFLGVIEIGKYVLLASNYDGKLILLDMENKIIEKHKIVLSKKNLNDIFKTLYREINYENDEINLQNLIEFMDEI